MRRSVWIAALASALGCTGAKHPAPAYCAAGSDLAAMVDPLIGTHGSGNTIPGAAVPHGLVKLSPDTDAPPGSIDAYEYGDARIEAFSHTHLEGPGGSADGYSQIAFLPAIGPLRTGSAAAARYSHDGEQASPGYYAVTLTDSGVRAELTATGHAGFHRYTFPASSSARVMIDLGHSRGVSKDGAITIDGDRTVDGFGAYNVYPLLALLLGKDGRGIGESTIYFHAVFSRAFDSTRTFAGSTVTATGTRTATGAGIGAILGFRTSAGEAIEVRVGISRISVEQAKQNLEEEVGAQTFEQVRDAARARWNCYLNRVQLEGGSDVDRRRFYTALYHSLLQPADATEAGGAFSSGAGGTVESFRWTDHRFYTDDWCVWDTFRTAHPLATLIEPERVNDVIASYLHLYTQGGWLPKCLWQATGHSRVMIGNHAVSLIADALAKGFDGFDREVAWEAVYKSAMHEDLDSLLPGLCGYFNQGTPPEYVSGGYVTHECDPGQSASMTLEYAYDDWCTARIAERLGKKDQAAALDARAGNYKNVWDAGSGFMRGKRKDGSWVTPFDPARVADGNDFTEASSWIYSWFVPHDVPGLIALMGGPGAFVEKLDRFFSEGHANLSNEPTFHTPYLYNLAGAPAKTQAELQKLLASSFDATPSGLPGNDDSGATSAWFVLSAMGLYPIAPGDPTYQLSTPLFSRLELELDPNLYGGKRFAIETTGTGPFIQSAALNGEPLHRANLTHQEVVKGGTLTLELGPAPSSWGAP